METGFLFLSLRRPVTLNWAPREAIKHKSLYSPTLREKRYSTTFRTFNSGIRKLGWMVTSGWPKVPQFFDQNDAALWKHHLPRMNQCPHPQNTKSTNDRIKLLGAWQPLVQAKHCFTVSSDERPTDAANGRCSLAGRICCKNEGRRAFESQLTAPRWAD